MIKVSVISNAVRNSDMFDPATTTPRAVLEHFGVDYTRGVTSLDGSPLGPGDMDKTFAQIGITEKCHLTNVVKADNA